MASITRLYVGAHDPKDPQVSPIRGDLRTFPPTLCLTSKRDFLLSGTVTYVARWSVRACGRAGVRNQLMVFDGLPHAFWTYAEAAPVSALGGYGVIAVEYRLAPEHRYPAASEDVAAVYTELLKSYKPI